MDKTQTWNNNIHTMTTSQPPYFFSVKVVCDGVGFGTSGDGSGADSTSSGSRALTGILISVFVTEFWDLDDGDGLQAISGHSWL